MKQQALVLIVLVFVFALSCRNNDADHLQLQTSQNEIHSITKDFMTWYTYHFYKIRLAQDFIGLDIDSNNIDKQLFLKKLSTGNYAALKTGIKNTFPLYQLFKLQNKDSDIQTCIKQLAIHEIDNEKMEGKEIPDFNFTDMNGIQYSKANTYNKILVLKCWFVQCVQCVKEFPELNKLVDEYHQNKNILFVSLARDSKETLSSFLSKKPFKYAVVDDQTDYIQGELDVNEFPTHILIYHGKIIKVTNDIEDMIPAINRETEKASN